MMDFFNDNTRVLSNQYQMIDFTLFDCREVIGNLYYFKDRGDFFQVID